MSKNIILIYAKCYLVITFLYFNYPLFSFKWKAHLLLHHLLHYPNYTLPHKANSIAGHFE